MRFAKLLAIGLLAGSLDIGENLVYNHLRGIGAARVFRFIASGLLGSAAARGGTAAALLGAAMHYSLALGWTLLYYALSRRWRTLVRHPAASGLIYGAAVWLFMNRVAVPLSRVPPRPPLASLGALLNSLLPVMLCIGFAIALLVARLRDPRPASE